MRLNVVDILSEQLYGLLAVLPALLKAVFILIIGLIIARILRRLVKRGLQLIGLDKLADKLNEIELFRSSGVQLKISNLVGSLVYYFTLLVFFMASIEALGMQMVSQLLADLIDYIPQAITAFALLLVGLFVADAIKKMIQSACKSLGIKGGNLIATVIFYFIFLNVILISLRQAELQTEFMENNMSIILAGVAGAFAIGYGLASRNIMANILASFYNRGRLNIGDEISIEGRRGEIIQLSGNSITLRVTDAETELIIPFHKLSTVGVEVHSRRGDENTLPPHEG